MGLSASEQATLNFYEWEYLGRGYYHFDISVEIEPPYLPFQHRGYSKNLYIDDGKVPSLFKSIFSLFDKNIVENSNYESPQLIPNPVQQRGPCTGFSFSFSIGEEILTLRAIEFLNMLSFTQSPVSFEILGKEDAISVQLVCSRADESRIESHLRAYFPSVIIKNIDVHELNFNLEEPIAICDFGLNDEMMRPINISNSFAIDPLTSIIATLEALQKGDTALFQVLFKGVTAPWAKDIPLSVSDGSGGSFFVNSPEMPACAQEKVSAPLFSCVMRIASQGNTPDRSQYLSSELAHSVTVASRSKYNRLIPLSNEGYEYEHHLMNIYRRTSNRLGMILNSEELSTFVHYPNKTVVSYKLGILEGKTKLLQTTDNKGIEIGINLHNGQEHPVYLDTEKRLSHIHIIGATGVGKSTLIANMLLADVNDGRGCALFDPHGDICNDVLLRIPPHRKNDVIIIDPSDTEFPIGFNLLEAHSEVEKIVLSSDLVSAFKRYATAWGDNMTAVLQNAINTFLDSTTGGTLIDLKRFLIEEAFRIEYLLSVEDPSLHYYWKHEYPLVRKGIAPLLTRIDTFLRPKIIRYMLAQRSGIDFKACLEENKIVLIKLSQGLIGEENSYLLGSLFLAKLNQAAMARQLLHKENRYPYFLYLDEFQHFITPSIGNILSGARKYSLGLTLAHQELSQVENQKLLNSVLSNPHTRICFRLGDNDAKRLESGFSYFDAQDLMALSRGEAIIRIETNSNDGNLQTFPLTDHTVPFQADEIIESVRAQYATPQKQIEDLLISMLPKTTVRKSVIKETPPSKKPINEEKAESIDSLPSTIPDYIRSQLVDQEIESIEIRSHTYLQSMIKKLGQDRNYIATVEYPTDDGGRIDILLEREGQKIAFEISETNKPAYEVNNIKKCLKAGCLPVVVVSRNKNHLENIRILATETLTKKDLQLVHFIQPDDVSELLNDMIKPVQQRDEVIKGFRVVTEFENEKGSNVKDIKSRLARLFKPQK